MDYREEYLAKMNRIGANRYERTMKNKAREFVNFFESALNKEPCLIDGKPAQAVFQDHSQSNNKDLSDDKYLILPNETVAGIGSYVTWRDSEWLVFTEEDKTIPTHQQLKIKEVNWKIKWVKPNKEVVGYGAYVQNQTLYTLGVDYSGELLSVVNGKMMMYMQNNDDTRDIRIGKRVFIGDDVYKILFSDRVSRNGLINFLMEEDTINENDNKELGIADYWGSAEVEEVETTMSEIAGNETAKIGSIETYTISTGDSVSEWVFDTMEGSEQPFYVMERTQTQISLQFKNDFRYVGQTINIIATLDTGDIVSLPVRVIKKF